MCVCVGVAAGSGAGGDRVVCLTHRLARGRCLIDLVCEGKERSEHSRRARPPVLRVVNFDHVN